MCGLFGIFAPAGITTHEKWMFGSLGIISSLRGTDSTGMILGRWKKKQGKKPHIDQKKDVMSPTDFFQHWEVKKALGQDQVFLLAGHCREATSGLVNLNNAHPIQADKIILNHNGTISKWRPDKSMEAVSSDSRIFAGKISSLGVTEALKEAEQGDYAVTFVDTTAKTFNIARKAGRTLFCVFVKDGSAIMWASEDMFLETVLRREGVRHNWGKVELIPQHRWLKWGFNTQPDKGESIEYDPFDYRKYATKVEPSSKTSSRGTDEPTKDDSEAYNAWMEARGKTEKDWVPYHGDVYGDPSLAEEMWENDPPAETVSRADSCKVGPQLPQRQETLRLPAPKGGRAAPSRFYCKKCKERADDCGCKVTELYSPPAWELDAKGRWIPEAAAKATSVPSVGRSPSGDYSVPLGKLVPCVSTPEHDAKLKEYLSQWNKDDDDNCTYIGYLKQTMSPSTATEKLKAGCSICGDFSDWKSTVYWYSDWGHVCCKHTPDETIHFLGNVSTYKSRHVDPKDFAEGEKSHAVH